MRVGAYALALAAVAAGILGSVGAEGAAPVGVWTAIGPYGGAVIAQFAVDQFDPQTVNAATRAGVWKSTDGASSWSSASQGLEDMYVTSIAVDPARPARLFAGTSRRLYRSDDAGATWTAVDMSPLGWQEYDVVAIAVAPSRPDTIYAADPNGLFRSTDAGAHWARVHQGQGAVVTVDPRDADVVYFSTPTQLVKSTDGGAHWTGLPIENPYLSALVVDPSHPDTLYAADGKVRKSTDGGATWTLLATEAGHDLFSLDIPRSRPATIYAGGRYGSAAYLARSDDGGASWVPLATVPGGSGPSVVVATDPAAADVVYAGTFYHGVYKSTDRGATFAEANDGLGAEPAWAIAFDPRDDRTIYASIGESGLFRSSDDGASWIRVDAGLRLPNRELSVFALSTDRNGTVYAARNFDAPTQAPAVMKSSDQGGHWSSAANGLPSTGVFAQAVYVDPTAPDTVFAALNVPGLMVDDDTGGLYKTVDGGDSWSKVSPTNKPVQALAFQPETHTIALASGTLGPAGDVQLYESKDWGGTWSPLAHPGFRTRSLAFGPTTATLYAGGDWAVVAKSVDGGATWTQNPLDPVTHNGPGLVNAVAVDPADPALVYAATESAGIWWSSDAGTRWQALVPGIDDVRAMTLAFPPPPPGARSYAVARPVVPLYGGSGGAGIERIYPAPHAIFRPFLSGRARVGRVLVCHRGAWSRATAFRYVWLRGTIPLVRHKALRYRVTRRDRRSSLRCRVGARGPGGTTRALTRAVRVRR